jgi:hypothetical protein
MLAPEFGPDFGARIVQLEAEVADLRAALARVALLAAPGVRLTKTGLRVALGTYR